MDDYSLLKEKVEHGSIRYPIQYLKFDLTSLEKEYPNRFYVDRHWHSECEILYVEKGTLELEQNLNTIMLHEGDIAFIDSEDLHAITGFTKDTIHHAILFDPQLLSSSMNDAFQNDIIAPFLEHISGFSSLISPDLLAYSMIHRLVEDLIDCLAQEGDYAYYEAKVMLFQLFLIMYEMELFVQKDIHYNEEQRLAIDRYKMIQSYIKEHYKEEIHLEELAELIECSENYVGRLFKKIRNDSPIHYLIQYRIEKACELLRNTTMSVYDICLEVGFTNASYFIRQFKECMNTTPLKYRKSFLH